MRVWPMYDELLTQIVERQSQFTDVKLDSRLVEPTRGPWPWRAVHVVAQVSAEQKVDDDEQVLVVVECEPEIDEERML